MSNFFEQLKARFNIHFNDQQKAAVMHEKGPALILAGPGSGKTTVITARTAYLIFVCGIRPDRILTVTFNKAAQLEMKNRFQRIFENDLPQTAIFSTLHSLCYSVIKDYERRQGKQLKLIEGEAGDSHHNKQRILKDLYKEINNSTINEDELEILTNEIGLIKNKMLKEFSGLNLQSRNFEVIYKAYDDYKKQNLLMDFDDMLTYCYSILNKCPDILDHYRNCYTHYQVDEGQDLSRIQFEILKMLVQSDDNNLFLVADDDQSIYGFRGAEPRYILELEKYFNRLKLYKLENNYRSSRNIVEISSQLIRHNKERYDKSHKTNNPEGVPPFLVRARDEQDQLSYIMNKIKEHRVDRPNTKIAILYRSNLSSIALVDKFNRESVSFRLKQNRVVFFQHWLVQDVLGFLKFSMNPCDSEAFSRIYSKMNRYISKVMMENALNLGFNPSVLECIIKGNDLKSFQVNKLHEVIREFKKLAKMSPTQALHYIEHDFKYFASVKEYCDNTGLSFDYLYGLFGILKTLAQACKTLPSFLSRLEKLPECFENNREHQESSYVTLTTLHSSKGLEYDVVFMVDLTNQEIPGERALAQAKRDKKEESFLEEERRLFYVGMTRAKTWLYLVSPDSVNDVPRSRSTFVNEVCALLNQELNVQLGEGVIVHHKKYGRGVVFRVTETSGNTNIEVDFQGKVRVFDLNICLENGIITLE